MNPRSPLPIAIQQPSSGRVLLLAPHADDDVIGAGGSLCLHRMAGDPVHVIVAFSGLAGDPDGRYSGADYAALRQAEAREGGSHLGLSEYEFWGQPEGHEPSPEELIAAVRTLAERIREWKPDIIYAPWIGEYHLDHYTLSRVAQMALYALNYTGEAWGWEVWTPLIPTHIVDISSVYERKVAALRAHQSQLAYQDLIHMGLSISAQRSMYISTAATHGEAFCPLGEPLEHDAQLLNQAGIQRGSLSKG